MELVIYFQEMWGLAQQGESRGIFFYVAIYFFLMAFYSLIYQLKMRSWPGTTGELVQAGVRKFGGTEWRKSDQKYVVSVLYKYVIDGIEYQGNKVSAWSVVASYNAKFILKAQLKLIEHISDEKIRVFYNPNNPKKSILIKPGNVGIVITIILSVITLVLYWLKYHSK